METRGNYEICDSYSLCILRAILAKTNDLTAHVVLVHAIEVCNALLSLQVSTAPLHKKGYELTTQ